ncbi:MAG: type II toxin-antitoxin system RelE/ParE family toxin [Thermodesulfobacteriota bacterium]
MSYRIEYDPLADKQAAHLEKKLLRRLQTKIRELAENPLDPRLSKPVTMSPDRRSARVGDWRIIYYLDEPGRTIFIAAFCPRAKAYEEAAKRGKRP